MTTFKVGDNVRTKNKVCGPFRRGKVIRRDGAYVFVQMNARPACIAECYDSELEKARK